MVNGIEEFAIKFVTDKRTPLEKARALHVAVTERFNELINGDPVLRPDLKEYPLPIKHTKVYISFEERRGCYYEDGTVAYVNQENDTIYYYTEPPMVYGLILYTLRYFMKSDMKMLRKSFRKLLQKANRNLSNEEARKIFCLRLLENFKRHLHRNKHIESALFAKKSQGIVIFFLCHL